MSRNPNNSGVGGRGKTSHHQNVHILKRQMTLDLNNAKKPRDFSVNDVLSSPDVQKLNITTPELNRMILNTAPGPLQTPTSVHKFENALQQLHQQDSVHKRGEYDGSSCKFDNFSNVVVKQEPQAVSERASDSFTDSDYSDGSSMVGGTKSILPVDIESQERMKLERKRQRNRLAASKCRSKKLERIAKLEEKVKQLKNENSELEIVLARLQNGVQVLKTQVYEEHMQAGCKIVVQGMSTFT